MESFIDLIDFSKMSPRQRARFERHAEDQRRLTEEAVKSIPASSFGAEFYRDEPLSSHTALAVGGPADAFLVVNDREALKEAIAFAEERNLPCLFLGSGSGMIVKDGGVRGMVIRLGSGFEDVSISHEEGEDVLVRTGARTSSSALAKFALERGLQGAERLSEWDGTLAGRARVSPGILAGILDEITVIDKNGRETSIRQKDGEDEFSVRIPKGSCIVSLLIRLKKGCGSAAQETSLQPPAIKKAAVKGLFKDVGRQTAASIIADAGLSGIRIGRMRVGKDDSNSIINEGNSTAKMALKLIDLIRDRVRETTGLALETAITIIGED